MPDTVDRDSASGLPGDETAAPGAVPSGETGTSDTSREADVPATSAAPPNVRKRKLLRSFFRRMRRGPAVDEEPEPAAGDGLSVAQRIARDFGIIPR